ncbi:MAG: dephospho-CoA kinase, partial [Chloroflexi bacterium HGW-Chloroflexi-9]
MNVIGLTGGIAAGKSTAAELLREFGAVVIDADRLGHRSYEPGTPGFEKVVNHFGHDVVGKDGNIDRRILGGKVFGAPGELQRLNELIWPEIRTLIREEIAQIRTADKNAFIVLEAAVLIEAGWQDLCDEIWVVHTSTKSAVHRLRTRNGLTEDAAMARIDSQMSTKDRLSYAQVKIENSGTEEQLRQRMEKAWKSLIDRTPAAKRPAGLKPAPRAAAAAKTPAKPAAK